MGDTGEDLAGTCGHRRVERLRLGGPVQEEERRSTLSGCLAEPENEADIKQFNKRKAYTWY